MVPLCDETCSCPLGESCLGRIDPAWSETMRRYWESGDEVLRAFVLRRSRFPASIIDPAARPAVVTVGTASPDVRATVATIPARRFTP